MPLTSFGLASVLTRAREGINLTACNVYIAKGIQTVFTFANKAAVTTLLTGMEIIGINEKGSPSWKTEDIVKEVDYEDIKKGVKGEGTIVLSGVDQGLVDFLDTSLRNETITLVIIPKDWDGGDKFKIITGVRLSGIIEGKANDESGDDKLTLKYKVRAKKRTDFERIIVIPAS